MAELKLYFAAEIATAGKIIPIGSKSVPVVISLDSTAPEYHYNKLYLADNAEGTLCTVGTDISAPIKAAIFYASVDMTIGFSGSSGADSSTLEIDGGSFVLFTGGKVKPYNATFLTRLDEANTLTNIITISAGNNSGATGYIEIWAVY